MYFLAHTIIGRLVFYACTIALYFYVFTKSQIYERVWQEDFTLASTSVSDHISSLRQKLGLNARDGRYIQTVFGVGYRFVAEPSGS